MNITDSQVKPVALEAITLTRVSVVEAEKSKPVEELSPVAVQNSSEQKHMQNTSEQLQNAVSQINEHVQNLQRSLQFTVDDKSGKDVVTVLDTETKEVIRQYPSEEVLQIARNLSEQQEHDISLFSSSI